MNILFDPLLRGPLWGSLFIAVACSLLGVFAFVRRESLIGETLAHSTYPGVVVAALITGAFSGSELFFFLALFAAALSCGWLALKAVVWCKVTGKLSADAALCFVLAGFFAAGMLGSSLCQCFFPFWQRQITPYLFGQVSVMDDSHLVLGALAAAGAIIFTRLFFRSAGALAFDPAFCTSSGLSTKWAERFFHLILAVSVVLSIKSMGVVLMSGLLIAPAICARQCTSSFSKMLLIAPCFGVLGTIGGLSASLCVESLSVVAPGPLIVLTLSGCSFLVHLVAPREGFLVRRWRRACFQWNCLKENLLKVLWRLGEEGVDRASLKALHLSSDLWVSGSLYSLRRSGLISKGGWITLTEAGRLRAQHIVRLHRLWEAYLASCLDVSAARVHASAEQIEHILTPDLEEQLEMLVDTELDPHARKIPEKEGSI